jgi:hypothetical protein
MFPEQLRIEDMHYLGTEEVGLEWSTIFYFKHDCPSHNLLIIYSCYFDTQISF